MSRTHLFVATIALLIAFAFVRQHGAIAHAASVVPPTTQGCVPAEAQGAPIHRAGLVVTFGDRHSRLFCIEFTEDSISGLELLQRSGLAVVTSAMGGLGGAVCRVEDPLAGTGDGSSDSSNCLLPCSGGTCMYWAYYHFTGGAWGFSPLGGSSWQIHDGDIDGWAWGLGGISSGAAPAPPGDICPAPTQTPTATATPQPTFTPEPAPSAAPPSATAAPDDTAVPTVTKTRAAGSPTIVEEPTVPIAGSTPPGTTPQVTPLSEVEAGAVTPDGAAPTASAAAAGDGSTPAATSPTSTPSATPTLRSGVAIVGADAGKQNAARAERTNTSRSGGGAAALWTFGAVAAALAALGAFAIYRRRRTGQLL